MKTRDLCSFVLLAALSTLAVAETPDQLNPAATGFDLEGSDARAIEIADSVMAAMGGRDAWAATRHVRWRFFGRRLHVWDKHSGDIRIEGEERESGEPYVILMNLADKTGRAWRDGREITAPEELAAMLDRGEAAWINDSYWMFMPFKLKDTGVTLRYVEEGDLEGERAADILELTFREVGRTPENKYHVWVSRDRALVEQWAFFASAQDAEPRFVNPWGNWQRYGSILLSDDRGDGDHSEIAVFEALPGSVYSSPEPIDWSTVE